MNKWWNIRKLTAVAAATLGIQAAAASEILIYGDIGESFWEETVSAKSFVQELSTVEADALLVRINSFGGSVPDGLAIYNALRRHKAEVTTSVEGVAFSIASLIAMAGDKREMAANALMMVHAPWMVVAGNAAELRDAAAELDVWAAAMATSYATATGKSQADALALLADGKDHFFTADEAKAEGYITAITDAQEPAAMAAAVGSIGVCDRYRDMPAAWLQACGGAAAVQAAAISAASAAPTQEANMNLRKFSVLAGLRLMNRAGNDGTQAGSGSGTTPPANGQQQPPANGDVTAAQREAVLAAERARVSGIRAEFKPFMERGGVAELLQECVDAPDMTPEAAGRKLLAHLGRNSSPAGGANADGTVRTVEAEADKRRNAIVSALLVRAGRGTEADRKDINANPFRGRTLLAIAENCLIQAGVRTELMDPRQIVGLAFTQGTSDFTVLLENALHKTLEAAYVKMSFTWNRWCKTGTVSDFREHKRLRLGSIGNLQSKNELGEFKHVALPDAEKQGITAGTKGLIITISREAIINDDLGGLTDQAAQVGQASARTIETDVFASLLSNSGAGPTMSDGNPLFHSSHNNIIAAGGAPSSSQFRDMRTLIKKQMEHTNTDYLDLDLAVGLFPVGMDMDARLINENEYEVSTSKNQLTRNIGRGMFQDIVGSPRITGTPYYGFADPNVCAAMEVAFLNGQQTPYTETQSAFTTDGGALKARLDYGVGGHNWRGAVKNPGA